MISSTSALPDDGVRPFGGGQLRRIVGIVVHDLDAVEFARRAAQLRDALLVEFVQIRLEHGVIAHRVVHRVVAVLLELRVVTVAHAHEYVDLARLEDPLEAGHLAEVEHERVRAALLALLAARRRAAVRPRPLVLIAEQNILWMRRVLSRLSIRPIMSRDSARLLLAELLLTFSVPFSPPVFTCSDSQVNPRFQC